VTLGVAGALAAGAVVLYVRTGSRPARHEAAPAPGGTSVVAPAAPAPVAAPVVPAAQPGAPPPVVPPPALTRVVPTSCPADMILIPAGTFLLGAPDGVGTEMERPRTEVHLRPYCIQRTEVTVAQYRACVEAGRCTPATPNPRSPGTPYCRWGRPGFDDHAINCVTWDQARAYCGAIGGALPTEAQWEYAARGADGRTYPWGNELPGRRICWLGAGVQRNSLDGCAVGTHPLGASPFGVMDMAGSIAEWTADAYTRYDARRRDGETPVDSDTPLRVTRDGAYTTTDPDDMRATRRSAFEPSATWFFVGIRCVI
jgi:formylglycine-generating enzyme required for sulfatase activity